MKKKILVIQLSRFGDILMTLPLLKELSNKYSVYFLYNILFKDIPLLNTSDFISIPVDFNHYYTKFINNSLLDNINVFNELIDELNQNNFDIVLNLSSQPVSAVLNSLLKAQKKYGLYIMYDGSLGMHGKNMSFFFEMKEAKKYNRLHQMDFYKTASDDFFVNYNSYLPLNQYVSQDVFKKYNLNFSSKDKIITIQPSASLSKKEFDSEKLNNVLLNILNNNENIKIIILGAESEIQKNSIFNGHNFFNLTGKTNIIDLISLLNQSDLLITNDTGTMHFAASLNIKIILISSGSAFFYETAAYNKDVFILAPQNSICYPCQPNKNCLVNECKNISYDVIEELTTALLFNKKFNYSKNDLLKSVFFPDGYIYYIPLNKRKITEIEYAGWLYHHLWKKFFKNEKFVIADINNLLEKYYIIDVEIIKSVNDIFNQYMNMYIQAYDLLKTVTEHNYSIKINQFKTLLDYIINYEDSFDVLLPLKKYREIRFHSVNSTDIITIIKKYTEFFSEWKKLFIDYI
jgi:ADP-heptose:LPS heptosyltransferase